MKRITTLSFFLCFSIGLMAQSSDINKIGREYIKAMSEEWHLKPNDVQDLVITDQYVSKHNGVTHVYYTQQYKGIPIDNAITSINITKEGKVAFAGNQFIGDLSSRVTTTTPSLSPAEVLFHAAQQLGITNPEIPQLKSRISTHKVLFEKSNFSHNDIPVQLKYQLLDNGKLALVWDIAIDVNTSADYWSVRADATTGEILSQRNWTVYCKFDKTGVTSHNHDCGAHSVAENYKSSMKIAETNAALAGTYNVYPFPAESPLESTQTLVTDPHLVAASPLGWHDTDGMEGPEFTITRGNNVHAYLDADGTDNSPDLGSEPDGGDALIFDATHDVNAVAQMSADAAVTNLFYANNAIHDISYLTGFTEEAGNFQENNYGNGGVAGDPVLAEAQDGTGTDNANFATPGDGGSGRMQMFLWTNDGGGNLSIDEPAEIAGIVTVTGTGDFGPDISTVDLTGEAAIARNAGGTPTDGCSEILNAEEINGRIALIDRGQCFFSEKTENAEAAGAIAVLICNVPGINGGTGDEVLGMTAAPDAGPISIPVLFCQVSTCNTIRASLNAGVPVTLTMKQIDNMGPPQFDASFDNGVMAHEFGHGISNRLTGGPSAAGCLGNDEQMGEGWSDFFTLVTTAKQGDTPSKARAIGNYVASQGVNGRGIRSQPYSTDFNVNNKTYDNIKGTTAPHPLGEVWVACLWDIYWGFVDLYGFDADWNNTESGNFKAVQLVMDGMKFQTCSPGFVEGRDAIIAADIVTYDGAHECMLWNIFARRGVGFNADGGTSLDRNDGTENFDSKPQCITELKISKEVTALVSADNEIDVTLTITNHFPSTVNNLVVTDAIPSGATYVAGSASMAATESGSELLFNIESMAFDQSMTITYKLLAGPDKSQTLLIDDLEADLDLWNIDIEGTNSPWLPSNRNPRSGSSSWYIQSAEAEVDQKLIFGPFSVSGAKPTFRFWHDVNTQASQDGGFVEVSNDGGVIWFRVDSKYIRNGYPGPLSYSAIPIPALQAFSGNTGGYIDSYIDMSDYVGQDVHVRFRYGSDATIVALGENPGWFVDDVELMDLLVLESSACVTADETSGCSATVRTIIDSNDFVAVVDAPLDFFAMQVFPNPTSDQVNVSISAKESARGVLSISSIDGKVILTENITVDSNVQTKAYNVSNLTAGFYFVKIETDLGTVTQKLTIH